MRTNRSIHPQPDPATPASTPALRTAFTLLELILVMLILAIAAAMIVPSLMAFGVGRTTDNASTTVLNLAAYARSEAISEGRTYRLNFDTTAGQIWLTAGTAGTGVFTAPTNDYGNKFTVPSGLHMDVDVIPQYTAALYIVPPGQQQPTAVQPTVPFGQPLTTATNNLIQLPRTDPGTYIEFQPSGRTDPALIKLTDKLGKVISLGLATSTDVLHVLTDKEMQ